MSTQLQGEFVKVLHESENEQIKAALASGEIEIQCICKDKQRLILKGIRIVNGELVAELIQGTTPITLGSVALSFSLKLEQYFFHSVLQERHDHRFLIDFSQPFYKLQRRKDFRINIPLDRKIYFNETNDPIKKNHTIVDLSRGGCGIIYLIDSEIDNLDVCNKKINSQIKGSILQGTNILFPIEGIIKIIKSTNNPKEKSLRLGVMFTKIPEKQVMSLVMEIYRDHFSRYSNK